MKVSAEVHRIIKCTIYSAVFFCCCCYFFTSGGGVDDVLVRLVFIEQIIKNMNSKHIQCQTSTGVLGIVNEFDQ